MRSTDGSKAANAGDNDAVITAGTMDDQEVSCIVSSSDNPDVTISRVKHKIAGLGLGPCDRGAIGMLGYRASTVAYDITAVCGVIKSPVYKAGAVEAIGPVCACSFAASSPYLFYLSPAAIPADHKGFAAPKVGYFADKLTSSLNYGTALWREIVGKIFQKLLCLHIRNGKIGQQSRFQA